MSARPRALLGPSLALLGALALGCRPDLFVEDHPERPAPTSKPPRSQAPRPTSTPAPSQEKPASVHLEMGTPKGGDPSRDYVMIKPQYALSYNKERNGANWVSWRLEADDYGPAPRHKGKFLPDESLPEGVYRVHHDDYSGSGYDRGHMVRSEDRTRTPEDNKATFLMTNILPQTHDLNAGPWLRLEDYEEYLAKKENRTLYVVAGGLFKKGQPKTIGKGVAVPDAFFKVIVVLDHGQGAADVRENTRVIAVIMPNEEGILGEGWGQYRRTVDEVEKRSGYELLPAVPEAVQKVIEARVDDGPTGP